MRSRYTAQELQIRPGHGASSRTRVQCRPWTRRSPFLSPETPLAFSHRITSRKRPDPRDWRNRCACVCVATRRPPSRGDGSGGAPRRVRALGQEDPTSTLWSPEPTTPIGAHRRLHIHVAAGGSAAAAYQCRGAALYCIGANRVRQSLQITAVLSGSAQNCRISMLCVASRWSEGSRSVSDWISREDDQGSSLLGLPFLALPGSNPVSH